MALTRDVKPKYDELEQALIVRDRTIAALRADLAVVNKKMETIVTEYELSINDVVRQREALKQQLDRSMRRQETLAQNVNAGLLKIRELEQQLAEAQGGTP